VLSRPLVEDAALGDYGEVLLLDESGETVRRAYPASPLPPQNMVVTDDGSTAHDAPLEPVCSQVVDFDHAAIARSMGVDGVRVEDPGELAPAIEEAAGNGRTTVIDVVTSLDQTFHQVTSPLMRRR
jgi:hypothetical protein